MSCEIFDFLEAIVWKIKIGYLSVKDGLLIPISMFRYPVTALSF